MAADVPSSNLTKEERQARRAERAAAGLGKRAGAERAKGGPALETGAAERTPAKGGARKALKVRSSVRQPRGADEERAPNARKVLVIGFQKTGTTTMTDALRTLGFSVAHASQAVNLALRGKELTPEETTETVQRVAFDAADQADAVQDSPYPLLFKELDARYPGSRFIYLERDPDSWVKSVVGHFGGGANPLRDWIYGAGQPRGNEAVYRQRFVDHRDEVHAYFKDRPGDLLVMNLAAGDGWQKLVAFLDDLLPPFPHRNKRG